MGRQVLSDDSPYKAEISRGFTHHFEVFRAPYHRYFGVATS